MAGAAWAMWDPGRDQGVMGTQGGWSRSSLTLGRVTWRNMDGERRISY